jgi:hypothetical protein
MYKDLIQEQNAFWIRGRRGRDRVVVEFKLSVQSVPTTINVLEIESHTGGVYSIYVIKFVNDRSVVFSGSSGFLHQ